MVKMLRPTLEEVRASGSTFYGVRVHPRKWDSLVTEGGVPPFSTLYVSKEILNRVRKERGRRWTLKPRVWDRKNRRWKYRIRHKPHLKKDDEWDDGEKVRWMWYTQEQWRDREIRNLNGVPHGNAYKIRREVWRVLNDTDVVSRLLLREGHDRGKLVRVTVSMPDLSLAITELFLNELLPKIGEGALDPEAVFLVLPTRGPGSGDIQRVFQKAVGGEIDEEKFGRVVNKSWRSIITKLIELHFLDRWEKKEGVEQELKEWVPPPTWPQHKEIESECGECNSRKLVFDEDRSELYCGNCGYMIESNYFDEFNVRCFKCGVIGHTSAACPTGN